MKTKLTSWMILPVLIVLAGVYQVGAQTSPKAAKAKLQTARVFITASGYSRTSINLRRGVPTRMTFVRQTDETCATEVVIPDYAINRALPLNVPVSVRFTPKRSGEVGFACGMNMMRGKLIVS